VRDLLKRIRLSLTQAWAIAMKDLRVYYFNPPMIMFGLALPVLLFFSFSMRRGVTARVGVVHLMSMILFFTASTAGPVILVLERRARTLDRLLTAPMSLATLLVGKTLVGVLFALGVSVLPLVGGVAFLGVRVAHPIALIVTMMLAALTFSSLGIFFGSFAVKNLGQVMMPSTMVRWPLLFVSGIFVPLSALPVWARLVSYVSPLTYAYDALRHAVTGQAYHPVPVSVLLLPVWFALFLAIAVRMQRRARKYGY